MMHGREDMSECDRFGVHDGRGYWVYSEQILLQALRKPWRGNCMALVPFSMEPVVPMDSNGWQSISYYVVERTT